MKWIDAYENAPSPWLIYAEMLDAIDEAFYAKFGSRADDDYISMCAKLDIAGVPCPDDLLQTIIDSYADDEDDEQ